MDIYKTLQECTGFEWDQHNIKKNWDKHKVAPVETEQVFFNKALIVVDDPKHSKQEKRFYALGRTDQNRNLFIAFTIRGEKIRIISSRDMNKKERRIYEERQKETNP
jgi:hypothetical protein